mmetsp:Transcript_640/g.1467  ORF Transcript_640/g.1467 Transcript_640/m.1467 type:complete len:143 (-) Transcript_640:137-565(-)
MDEVAQQAGFIYHLTCAEQWESQRLTGWFLTKDLGVTGFIHCTSSRKTLLHVANAYYKSQPGEFVVLKIEQDLLSSKVKYESPAAVHVGNRTFNGTEALVERPDERGQGPTLMPHVFGPINLNAVVDVFNATRGPDGTFQSV